MTEAGETGKWKSMWTSIWSQYKWSNHSRDPTALEPEITVLLNSVTFAWRQSYLPETEVFSTGDLEFMLFEFCHPVQAQPWLPILREKAVRGWDEEWGERAGKGPASRQRRWSRTRVLKPNPLVSGWGWPFNPRQAPAKLSVSVSSKANYCWMGSWGWKIFKEFLNRFLQFFSPNNRIHQTARRRLYLKAPPGEQKTVFDCQSD